MPEYSPIYMGLMAQQADASQGSGVLVGNISSVQTGNYTATTNDQVILVSGTLLPLIISLPSVGVPAGKVYTIKEVSHIGIGSNVVSGSILVTGVSSAKFDGTLTGWVRVGNQNMIGVSGVFGERSSKSWMYDGTNFFNIF